MNVLLRTVTVVSLTMLSVQQSGAASAQEPDPEQVVRGFMKEFYSADSTADFRKAASARRYFTPSAARIAIAQSKRNIDADFIVDGQDYEIKNLQLTKQMKGDARAVVFVNFNNFDQKVVDNFVMSLIDGKWLIENVCRPDKSCLLSKGL